MIYDLSLAFGWLPRDVRELTSKDLDGIRRAVARRDARSKRNR
jgi:hypothetical protein